MYGDHPLGGDAVLDGGFDAEVGHADHGEPHAGLDRASRQCECQRPSRDAAAADHVAAPETTVGQQRGEGRIDLDRTITCRDEL